MTLHTYAVAAIDRHFISPTCVAIIDFLRHFVLNNLVIIEINAYVVLSLSLERFIKQMVIHFIMNNNLDNALKLCLVLSFY